MAKYLVETYYNCSFKISHYLDDVNEAELDNLEKREDGKLEVIDVKLENRKTKSLDKNSKKSEEKKVDLISESSKKLIILKKIIPHLFRKSMTVLIKDLACQIEEKATYKKQLLEIIKYIFTRVNTRMAKLEKYLLIQVKKASW